MRGTKLLPRRIEYAQGTLVWDGFPRVKRDRNFHALPWLEVKLPRAYGHSLMLEAVLLTPDSITTISPSLGLEDTVSAHKFQSGSFSEIKILLNGDLEEVLRRARDMARQKAMELTGWRGMDAVRIER